MSAFPRGLILCLLAAFLFSVMPRAEVSANAVAPKPVPAGNLFDQQALCEVAIYLLPDSKSKPDEVLAKVLTTQKFAWAQVKQFPKTVTKPVLFTKLITDAGTTYKAPSVESLQYFGRGISKEQAAQLQTCEKAYLLDFIYPANETWKALKSANEVAAALGQGLNGLVWDEATREIFSPDEWSKQRLSTWPDDGVPDLSKQITIHAYKNDDYVRGITLGMSKVGLPDVVVSDFVWSDDKQIGNLIDLVAQALAEGNQLSTPGQFDLEIGKIKNEAMRNRITLLANATSKAPLGLVFGVPEQGDADNRLIEITFDRVDGADVHTRQDILLSALYGAEDKAKAIRHNAELLAVSQKAKDKLPALRDAFQKGFAPGEFIQVKEPFQTPDGRTEWMWVEVQTWKGDAIHGMLKNESYFIPTLHGGQMVDVSQADVFDYIHTLPDGTTEGNETGTIIEKMEQAK